MKLSRKLIPAFAMLLVSAIMLTTASFAWFSTNDQVSATGMSVKATTAENLVISADNSSFGTAPISLSDADTATANLNPVSINCNSSEKIGTNAFFYAVTDESLATVNYADGNYTTDTVFEQINAPAGYYETFEVYVKVNGEDGSSFEDIYVDSINVTRGATQVNISKSLRVAVTNGTKTYIYAPVAGAGYQTAGSIDSIDGDGKPTAAAQTITAVNDKTNGSFGEVSTTAITFTIYIWYEGQDVNCTSANALSVEDLSISISFKAE